MNAGKEGMSQGVKAYERILTRLIERYRKDNGLEKDQPLATEDVVVLQQQYLLNVLGTALAEKYSWPLGEVVAIDFALIRRYSWTPPQVQALSPAHKWLAICDELEPLHVPEEARRVWRDERQVWGPVPIDSRKDDLEVWREAFAQWYPWTS
ncbi:hypothetical protein LES24_29840 [Pseudomonas aeruginosa]|uniref:hypothetical protein n=1 Tax=Pseudomonas aeruginosa TaxID=287 RepID=UPI0038919B23